MSETYEELKDLAVSLKSYARHIEGCMGLWGSEHECDCGLFPLKRRLVEE